MSGYGTAEGVLHDRREIEHGTASGVNDRGAPRQERNFVGAYHEACFARQRHMQRKYVALPEQVG
jgi:hypothetical protein